MKYNEESILIFEKKNQAKKNIEDETKINQSISFYKCNLFYLIFIIALIIFLFLFITNIKSIFPSLFNTFNKSESALGNGINNQTLINELNNILKSFETEPQDLQKSASSKNPVISAIIPVYNNAEKIKLTIHSIQCQNISDIEIIIIDDNSKDNSVELIEQFQKNDPRIKLLKSQNNKGILYSRSIGVLNSKGKNIVTLNSGDMLINYIFKDCLEQVELNDIDIIEFSFYNCSYINSSLFPISITNTHKYEKDESIIAQPELSSFMYKETKNVDLKYEIIDEFIWGKLIKSSIYKKSIDMLNVLIYTEKVIFFESQIINFCLFKNANSFKFINKKGIIHIHNDKLINNNNQFIHDYIKYVSSIFKNSLNIHDTKIAVFEFENMFDLLTDELIKENKRNLFELYNEINVCNFIEEDTKKEIEIKMKNILK